MSSTIEFSMIRRFIVHTASEVQMLDLSASIGDNPIRGFVLFCCMHTADEFTSGIDLWHRDKAIWGMGYVRIQLITVSVHLLPRGKGLDE